MVNGKKIVVVMPAYNAGQTLEQTYADVPMDIVDDVILVDDCSRDATVDVARRLGIKHIIRHERNKGYGGNQKTCYDAALDLGADIVIMIHPDYQYTPRLIPAMVHVILSGHYPVVLGSRILGGKAMKGGMPAYKYVSNRVLTLIQNLLLGQKLSEYHTGFRAYSADVLKAIDYHSFSDNFIFDNQAIAAIFDNGYEIAEITCPTRYFPEASSIHLGASMRYGLGVLGVSIRYRWHKLLGKKPHRHS